MTAMEMDAGASGVVDQKINLAVPDHGLNNENSVFYMSNRVIANGNPWHAGQVRINVLFADGHVKVSPPIDVAAGTPKAMSTILPFADPSYPLPAGAMGTMCTTAGGEGVDNTSFCHGPLNPAVWPCSGLGISPQLPNTYNIWL
jgi:prepilin-type processing-associated H-X9-DG protein